MASWHQAKTNYLSQFWSMSPYGVTRPQWINVFAGLIYKHKTWWLFQATSSSQKTSFTKKQQNIQYSSYKCFHNPTPSIYTHTRPMGNYTLIQEIRVIPILFPRIKSGSKLYHRSYGTLGVSSSIQIDIQRGKLVIQYGLKTFRELDTMLFECWINSSITGNPWRCNRILVSTADAVFF